jgi:Mg-chelatase subunit ChlD
MAEELLLVASVDRPHLPTGKGPSEVTALLDVRRNAAVLGALLEKKSAAPPSHLILVVDVSGSMRWRLERGNKSSPRRIDIITDAARALFGRLNPADHLSIIAYDHAAQLLTPSPLAKADRAGVDAALASLPKAGGGRTCMAAGLELALGCSAALAVMPRVLVMTDGSDDDAPRAITAAKHLGQRPCPLDAMGIGEYRHSFLLALARECGGSAHRIARESDAHAVFDGILARQHDTIAENVTLEVWVTPEVLAGDVFRARPDILYLEGLAPDSQNLLRIPLGTIGRLERPPQIVLSFEVPERPAGARVRIARGVLRYDVPQLGVFGAETRTNIVVEFTTDDRSASERDGEVFHTATRARLQRQVLEIERLATAARGGKISTRDARTLVKLVETVAARYRSLGDEVDARLFDDLKANLERDGVISLDVLNASLAASSRAADSSPSGPGMLDF